MRLPPPLTLLFIEPDMSMASTTSRIFAWRVTCEVDATDMVSKPSTRMKLVPISADADSVKTEFPGSVLIVGPVTVAPINPGGKLAAKYIRISSSRVGENITRPPASPAASSAADRRD